VLYITDLQAVMKCKEGDMKSRMRSLRKKRGMTQQELAQKACVSRQTIISLESEKYDPSLVLAFKIAAIFGLPIEEIFLYNEKE